MFLVEIPVLEPVQQGSLEEPDEGRERETCLGTAADHRAERPCPLPASALDGRVLGRCRLPEDVPGPGMRPGEVEVAPDDGVHPGVVATGAERRSQVLVEFGEGVRVDGGEEPALVAEVVVDECPRDARFGRDVLEGHHQWIP